MKLQDLGPAGYGADLPIALGVPAATVAVYSVTVRRLSISPRGGLIPHPTNPRARRTPGVLLVAGFAALIPGFVVAARSQIGTGYIPPTFSTRVGEVSVVTGLSLTLLGLIWFDPLLWKAGDRVLGGLGTAAYAVAAVSWIIGTGREIALHEWTYDLEVAFIVAAGLSMLAFGAAVLRTGVIPRWAGWVAVGWSATGLVLFALPSENYPPLFVQFVPLLFGSPYSAHPGGLPRGLTPISRNSSCSRESGS